MPFVGLPELLIVLVVVLLVLGPKRLPGLGKQLGSGMREFKDSITSKSGDDDDEHRPELTSASAPPRDTPTAVARDAERS